MDVAAHLDLPRQSRRLPDTLDVGEVDRLLEAAPRAGGALRDRALLELLYAAGLRVSEAIGLDREDLSLDGAFVRVIGKGDKERLVPIGEVALDWLDDLAGGAASPLLVERSHVAPARGGPLFLGERGRRLARQRPGRGHGAAPRVPGSPRASARTRSGTRSRPTCSKAAPTCGSSRSCSDMPVSPRRSCTRI